MIQKFNVEHRDTMWECKIEVDPEFKLPDFKDPEKTITTLDCIKMMVEFWTGSAEELSRNDGDYVKTFVQQLAREIFYIIIEDKVNITGVIDEFKNREGWTQMDGSYGIWIRDIDNLTFDNYEFEVEEIS